MDVRHQQELYMQLSAQPVLVSPIGLLDCLQYSTDEGQCDPVASLRLCASLDKMVKRMAVSHRRVWQALLAKLKMARQRILRGSLSSKVQGFASKR